MRQVVLDTETTGLDPNLGHRVIEIGCVELLNRRLSGRHFHTYLDPEREIDPGALQIHGLSREFLSDKPRFSQKVDDLLHFVADAEIIIHNAAFDVGFLNAELARLKKGVFKDYCAQVIDSLLYARELHPGKRNSLDALCDRYQISNHHRTLHGALLDAELLAEVWLAMTRGQDSLVIDFESDNERKRAEAVPFDPSKLAGFIAPEHAQAEHEAYLKQLNQESKAGAIWPLSEYTLLT